MLNVSKWLGFICRLGPPSQGLGCLDVEMSPLEPHWWNPGLCLTPNLHMYQRTLWDLSVCLQLDWKLSSRHRKGISAGDWENQCRVPLISALGPRPGVMGFALLHPGGSAWNRRDSFRPREACRPLRCPTAQQRGRIGNMMLCGKSRVFCGNSQKPVSSEWAGDSYNCLWEV